MKKEHFNEILCYGVSNSANIYLFKVNNMKTRKRCKIYLNLTLKTSELCYWRLSVVFIVNLKKYCEILWIYFKPFSSVSIVDVEQVNVG